MVSSDRSGNYYKTLAVLDGSGAIELKLDSERLFETYAMGCLVDVSCNGLTLGAYGGCLQLGTAPSQGYETGYVDEADIPGVVRIVGMAEEAVEPQAREIAALRPEDVGRFVSFDGVQFVAGGRAAWCDRDADDASGFADTDRYVVDRSGNLLAVRTSRRAGFASWPLPAGSGRIEGCSLSLTDTTGCALSVPTCSIPIWRRNGFEAAGAYQGLRSLVCRRVSHSASFELGDVIAAD